MACIFFWGAGIFGIFAEMLSKSYKVDVNEQKKYNLRLKVRMSHSNTQSGTIWIFSAYSLHGSVSLNSNKNIRFFLFLLKFCKLMSKGLNRKFAQNYVALSFFILRPEHNFAFHFVHLQVFYNLFSSPLLTE